MSSQYVRHGWKAYADYDRSFATRWAWLVSNNTADILSNSLAVFLTIAAKGSFTFAKRVILIIDEKYPDKIATEVLSAVRESHSPEGLFWRLCKLLFGGVTAGLVQLPATGLVPRKCSFRVPSRESFRDTWTNFKVRLGELPWALIIAFSMASLYVGAILGGIFSAFIAGNSMAISNHPGCRIFHPNDSTGLIPNPYWSMWQRYFHDLESESGEYARQCYNATDNVDGCNYFYEPSIQFTVKDNDTCPFKSEFGPLCIGGPTGAFTLRTGYVRPGTIGINTKLKYTFVREATCSPLIMDDRFVKPYLIDDRLKFRYFYGNSTGNSACSGGFSNCTCEISAGFQLDFNHPYSVFKQETPSLSKEMLSWRPNFEVNGTAGETATLIIVSNLGIGYPQKQDDPIFPAETTYDNNWYYNTRWHGGVLGCIDRKYICTPDAQCATLQTWGNLSYGDNEDARVVSYLYFSLLLSSIGSSIGYRGAEGLDANSKLVGSLSLELDTEQWKVEVLQLFQTSLARIQIYARNIARGSQNTPTYGRINFMDANPQLRGICNMYKFKSTGWRNISITGFFVAVGIGLIALFLGRTTENEEELRVEGYYRTLRDFKWKDFKWKDFKWKDFFMKSWTSLVSGFKNLLSWIRNIAKKCHEKFQELRERGKKAGAAERATTTHRTPNVTDPGVSDGIEM